MNLGLLILRLFVGVVFFSHGMQKLRGWFGGHGIEGTAAMTKSLGIVPAKPNAYAVAATEAVGGLAIAAGAATPLATVGLVTAMTTAIRTVHAKNGFFSSKGGWEFNGTLIAAVVALTAEGPGRLSLDARAGRTRWGIGWALVALAAGIGASFAVTELGPRLAGAERTAPDEAAPDDAAPNDAEPSGE